MHTRRGPLLETSPSILLSIPYITKPGLHVCWCAGDWPERGPAGGVGVMVCRPRSSPPPTAQPAIPWPEPSPASGHPFHCHWNMQLDTPVTRYATEGVNKVSPLCSMFEEGAYKRLFLLEQFSIVDTFVCYISSSSLIFPRKILDQNYPADKWTGYWIIFTFSWQAYWT